MDIFKIILVAVSIGFLNACAFLFGDEGMFPNPDGSYHEAELVPEMRIPSQLDSYTLDQLYVVPERFSSLADLEEVPLPKPIETRRREGVRIQSLNEKRWIVIDATPAQVWPLVRDYWTELQIILDHEDPSNGVMETSWVEVGSSSEKRHKYKITIEPGLHSGYSEIYILHFANLISEPVPLVLNWPENSISVDLEQQILTSVSQYLADRNDVYQASSSSLLAGSIESESKVNLIESESGEPILELRLEYSRAWVQIRQALETAEVSIIESDRNQSVFNVQFAGIVNAEDEQGFIGRWFSRPTEDMDLKDFTVRLFEAEGVVNVITEAIGSFDDADQLKEELLQVIDENLS